MRSDYSGRQAGFTLIELMVSMAVLTVGTTALFALQGYVARSNMNSKEMTIATSIAENWVERLKVDALSWNAPGSIGAPGEPLNNTAYLQDINNVQDAWQAPRLTYNAALGHSPGADLTGNEITAWPPNDENVEVGFCTNLRFNWVNTPGSLMRVDVRVFWPKQPLTAVVTAVCTGNAPPPSLDVDNDGVDDYRAVYTSTMIRWTP